MTPITPSISSASLDSFIQEICPHSAEITKLTLAQNVDVVESLIKDLETPLPEQLPQDIKVFHNGQLQKWFDYQPQFPRYFVKAIPNFQLVSTDQQVYVHYYFDGILAKFGVDRQVLINRVTPQQENLILEVLKQP